MKKLIISILIFNLTISTITSIIMAENIRYGIVNQSVINLYKSPKHTSELSSQAILGTPVIIIENKHGWINISTPEGYSAWTPEESVIEMNNEELQVWNKSPKLIVKSYLSILRTKPTEKAAVISDVILGNILINKGKYGKYYKVGLPDGRIGYLGDAYATSFLGWMSSHQPTAENIITMAKNFIGFPYLWGGTSAKAMDCSGFTETCFYLNGVILPRDADQQDQVGTKVNTSDNFNDLQPADLLFFGSVKDSVYDVRHVAIYIGNGNFIHASSTVRISSLLPESKNFDAYNTKRLLFARRIIKNIDNNTGISSIKKNPLFRAYF